MGRSVTLTIVGETNVQERERPEEAFSLVGDLLSTSDVLFGHLEGLFHPPSSDPERPDIPYKSAWRHADPSQVVAYNAAGFDAMCAASNVAYGEAAIRTTLAVLSEAGIPVCGIGLDRDAARRGVVVEKGGIRFGYLSYTSVFWPSDHAAREGVPGVATIKAHTAYQPGRRALEMPGAPPEVVTFPDRDELAEMGRDVETLRSAVDVLVVSCHWGVSSSPVVVSYQQAIGRAAIDAGADIVFGHHPHVIQPIEVWKGRPILYSMGNFAFDWRKMRGRNLFGLAAHIRIVEGRVEAVSLTVARRNGDNMIEPIAATDTDARPVLEPVIEEARTRFDTAIEVAGDGLVVDLSTSRRIDKEV